MASETTRVRPRAHRDLAGLAELPWRIVRLCHTQTGGTIVIAQKDGRIGAIELPPQQPDECREAWASRVDALLTRSAYDPTDSAPPVLLRGLPGDVAELVPHATEQGIRTQPSADERQRRR